ncbi:MAG: M14 family metallopeptidase [Janthinobacterium lividum]
MTPLMIDSRFDSGAIEVVECERADAVRLRLRPDNAADITQWFHFRVSGARETRCRFTIEGVASSAFPGGWEGYAAVASYDRRDWFRVPTSYDGARLVIDHTPAHDAVWYAYFEPYGESRHDDFLARAQQSELATLTDLGHTVQGRPLTCLTIAAPGAKPPGSAPPRAQIWVIARQHPGETMAEWFVEGLSRRLLGFDDWAGDALATTLLARADFHLIPNMNPDGAALGNLRTNAVGANLNREWMAPDAQRSPEVLCVREAIAARGCDTFFDIHGDETLPYVFVAGCEMLPSFDARQARMQQAFLDHFRAASAEFQTEHGYAADKYQQDALKLASKYIGHRYGCLSLTLEMPFKDNAQRPQPRTGWNGARSAALGAAMLEAIGQQLDAQASPAPVA